MSVPVVEAYRVGRDLIFECPHCWQYGGTFGCGVKRPKRARPTLHIHGVGDGLRGAHCHPDSPFQSRGYVLKEIGAARIDRNGKLTSRRLHRGE